MRHVKAREFIAFGRHMGLEWIKKQPGCPAPQVYEKFVMWQQGPMRRYEPNEQ
ncbi:hypothetical protein HPP92_028969 [Vanilla planifolia]|uniref:Uncharacterized protein n=1 Tax=Vanilla planifolia TaxID=51239 RepID=A0A835P401_VANPL|nr:hypothetical protein HPP92_028969 [Vanilla planifolia]KAG0446184.1 hypothetical protein HPP92_028958 [Vanilla planifolia]